MIFSESAVLKGQQLGKGQFGNVMKGVLLQGNAKYVKSMPDLPIIAIIFTYNCEFWFKRFEFLRFPIAIKTPNENDPKQTELLLEEAKNMLRLKRYHDHIVNLQGIIYKLDEDGKCISSVVFC